MFKAVIFDLDGVVVDSEPISCATAEEVMLELGMPKEAINKELFIGRSDKDFIIEVNKEYNLNIDSEKYANIRKGRYIENARGNLKAFPGIKQFINEVKNSNILFAIASSGEKTKVDFQLKEIGLEDVFPIIINSDDVHKSKPNPQIYFTAAKKLGVEPEECVAIEDAKTGLQSAKTAGMKTVAVATSFPKEELVADLVLESPGELTLEKIKELFYFSSS